MAGAFAEARAKHAVLVLDGIDGVAAERAAPEADRGALDALLAEMDDARLPLIAVADLPSRLDRAALRRFAVSVRLRPLHPGQAALAFRRMFGAEPPGPVPDGLTPGDFAAVRLRRDLIGGGADAPRRAARCRGRWVSGRSRRAGAHPPARRCKATTAARPRLEGWLDGAAARQRHAARARGGAGGR